jgi:hypothetical protein
MSTALGEVAHGCAHRLALSGVVPTFVLLLGSEPSAYPRFAAACTAFPVWSATSTGDCEGLRVWNHCRRSFPPSPSPSPLFCLGPPRVLGPSFSTHPRGQWPPSVLSHKRVGSSVHWRRVCFEGARRQEGSDWLSHKFEPQCLELEV